IGRSREQRGGNENGDFPKHASYRHDELRTWRTWRQAGRLTLAVWLRRRQSDFRIIANATTRSESGSHELGSHCGFQSGRMAPDTPSKAPATSSHTSTRAGSAGPGSATRPLETRLKPDLP